MFIKSNLNNKNWKKTKIDYDVVARKTNEVKTISKMTASWVYDYNTLCQGLPTNLRAQKQNNSYTQCYICRPENAAQVRYAESSMRNAFGLKYIHKFFNLPFLQLQVIL